MRRGKLDERGHATHRSRRRRLELFEFSAACPTQAGTVITGTYEVDGPSSTGVFAGARGSGDLTVDLANHTATLSGRLKLAGPDD